MAARVAPTLGLLLSLVVSVAGQDPTKVLPQAYKLDFENDWVKVTRVHYAAYETLPTHDHTESGAAYVYLNDCGPVIFKHSGVGFGKITRPATKAGSFRLYKAVKEVHEVENPNATPSDFLRVEFKTIADIAVPLRGKFFRETDTPGENIHKIHFENEQIRAIRLVCVKDKACDLSANATEPALLVALTRAELKSSTGKGQSNLEPGKTKWIAAGQRGVLINREEQAVEFLRFEFKTKPVISDANDSKKTNAHPNHLGDISSSPISPNRSEFKL